MVTDPIEALKRDLADMSVMLDRMQEAIKNSSQQEAAHQYQDVERQIEKVRQKLKEEFGWLSVKEE